MGWFDEALSTVENTVKGTLDSAWTIATAPITIGGAVLQGGGVEEIGKRVVDRTGRVAGAVVVNQSGGLIPLARTDVGQRVLDNKILDQATFGVSGDYAGYSRAAMNGMAGNRIAREDIDDSIRLGGKALTAGVGASVFGTGGVTTANYAGAQALQGGVKSGNYSGVISQLTGVPTSITNQLIPNAPVTMPTRNPAAVGITDPWTFGGTVYNQGGSTFGGKENLIYFAAAAFAVVGIAAAVAKRKK